MFIAMFQNVQKDKEEKKLRNKNEILATHISETAREISFKFGMSGGVPGRHLCSKTGSNRMRDHGATKVRKLHSSFFLSIYSQCGALASWATRHTSFCLDGSLQSHAVHWGREQFFLNIQYIYIHR